MLRRNWTRSLASTLVLAAGVAVAGAANVSAADLNGSPNFTYTGGQSFNWNGVYVGGTAGGGVGTNNGFIGGGTLGYNFTGGGAVWSIEGDFSGANIKNGATKLDYLGTLRGRIGLPVSGGLMPFISGGWAYGRLKSSASGISTSKEKSGWTAGGGMEWAIDRMWTLKGEYLYVDLGSVTTAAGTSVSVDNLHILRAGLNLKF